MGWQYQKYPDLTMEQYKRIEYCLTHGDTVRNMAKLHGIPFPVLLQRMQKMGLGPAWKGRAPGDVLTRWRRRAWTLHQEGADMDTIADKLGIEPESARQLIWRARRDLERAACASA